MKRIICDTTSKYKPMATFSFEQSIYCLLSQVDGNKEIFIEVGDCQAIHLNYLLNKNIFKIKNVGLYDTYINTLEKANIEITDLVIYDRKDKVWFGQIELYNKLTNELIYEDCKPSELMCLSIKLKKPIYIYDGLVKPKKDKKTLKRDFKIKQDIDISTLTKELKIAIESENYELATQLKNKIENVKDDKED